VGAVDQRHRRIERARVEVVLQRGERVDGVLQDARARGRRDARRCSIAGDVALREPQLEIRQAMAAHRAAEADNRGLTDTGLARDGGHRQAQHRPGLAQYPVGHLAFGRRERRARRANALAQVGRGIGCGGGSGLLSAHLRAGFEWRIASR
jgi:hypothetical protein